MYEEWYCDSTILRIAGDGGNLVRSSHKVIQSGLLQARKKPEDRHFMVFRAWELSAYE